MPQPRRIYTLNGLPPEVVAVAFAKTSRVPESFDTIARQLTDENSASFHEKWVVGYGHASVAEHAVLSIALENISILATKVVEDNRLASYTEKSTRYQRYDSDTFYVPPELEGTDCLGVFRATMAALMRAYAEWHDDMAALMRERVPQAESEGERLYASRTRGRVCDVLRYLLPVATQTNVGWTINARGLEHAITKLLSHPLAEMRDIGREVKDVCLQVTPTLIKYADPNPYLIDTPPALAELADALLAGAVPGESPAVRIVRHDPDAETTLATALLYPRTDRSYDAVHRAVRAMSDAERLRIVDEALARRGPHDAPPREFEHVVYTTEILVDYGAFRDIQRHRMATQTGQRVTVDHGYSVPEPIAAVGKEQAFHSLMEQSHACYDAICAEVSPEVAQYAVALAYRKRTLYTWNLRELFHFIRLRSGRTGHEAYRAVARALHAELERVHPRLARYIPIGE